MKEILSQLVIQNVSSVMTPYNEAGSKNINRKRSRWAVIIKYEGETQYFQGTRVYTSNIQNIVILPKGAAYEWMCTKSGHYAVIEFDCDLTYDQIFSFPVKNGEKILSMIKALEYKRLSKQPMYRMESIKETYAIILMLLAQSGSPYIHHTKEERLQPAIDHIFENYTKKLYIADLAALSGFSEIYFRRLFADIYGVPPTVYIKNLRIKKAKEMLRTDYGSISDIAVSLGYQNIYDFSRDFKKYTGIAPSKFKP